MPSDTRRQVIQFSGGTITAGRVDSYTNRVGYYFIGKQEVVSARDGVWPAARAAINRGSSLAKAYRRLDLGHGGFTVNKQIYRDNCSDAVIHYPSKRGKWASYYDGPVFPRVYTVNTDSGFWPKPEVVPMADLIYYGTKAASLVQPSLPQIDLARALLELMRDFPKVPGKTLMGYAKSRRIREADSASASVSNEYLNYTFGVAPTVSDLLKIRDVLYRSEDILENYLAAVNTEVRRRFEFTPVRSEATVSLGNWYPQPAWVPDTSAVPLFKTTVIEKKIWFSGAWVYNLPDVQNVLDEVRLCIAKANKLIGFNPVYTAYQLTPWTWLLDWFGSLGAWLSLTSSSSISNQVMRYGYIMASTSVEDTYTLKSAGLKPIGRDLSQTFRGEFKTRLRAIPFGFGLNPDTLSESQWATLAALGISRGPKLL